MLLTFLGEMELVQSSLRMPAAVDRDSLTADPTTGLINGVAVGRRAQPADERHNS